MDAVARAYHPAHICVYSGMDSASTKVAGCLLDHSSHCGPYAELTGAYWLNPPGRTGAAEQADTGPAASVCHGTGQFLPPEGGRGR